MAIGRPKIYDIADIIYSLQQYIETEEDPIIEGFTVKYGMSRDTLYELAKQSQALSDTMTRAIEKQRVYLLKEGTKTKRLEPQIVKLRLVQPCHGFSERISVDADVQQSINDADRLLLQRVAERLQLDGGDSPALPGGKG